MNHKGLFLKTFIETRWLHRFKNRNQLAAFQNKQLSAYYSFLRQHSPYFQKVNPEQFSGMNKQFMMAHFNELNTQGVDRDAAMAIALESERTRDFNVPYQHVAVGLSSGTSGHRGMFVTTEKERTMWAAAILAKMLPKRHLFGHRIAFFLRADNELYQTIHSKWIRLSFFDIFHDIDKHVARLNEYQPTIMIAPASMLVALAKAARQGHLRIAPSKIISVAEILEDSDRIMIADSFGVPMLHQVYQATEGFLGCTCAYGHLHLNEDIIHVTKNYIDTHRFYPIITDFKRTSQPIIAYELNDILVENREPCPCGSVFTRIEKIEGRSDDVFIFEGYTHQEVMIYPDFIRRCFLFVDQVGEYQAQQLTPQLLKIAISHRSPEIEATIAREFARLATEKQFIMPQLVFDTYTWDKQVKLKRIVSHIKRSPHENSTKPF